MSVKAEDENIGIGSTEKTKTKIVVHINNYIFDNAEEENTSNDLNGHLRSLATPDSFFLEHGSAFGSQYGQQYTNNTDLDISRMKKVSQPKNDCYVIHAKSMKFPVKIRPSYEIYPSSNVIEDKLNPWLNNKNFNSKFDINFQLPFISPSHQTAFQNYQARHINNLQNINIKPTSKVNLPNYLNTQYNMKPPQFTNRNSKSNPMLTYKKIIKLRDANSNENLVDKKENVKKVENQNKKNLITYGQNFERGSEQGDEMPTEKKYHENAHSQKNFR